MNWNTYINEVLPSASDREVFRGFAAAVLSSRRPEKILCLAGSGRGKSTLCGMILRACSNIEQKPPIRVNQRHLTMDPASVLGMAAGTMLLVVVFEGHHVSHLPSRLKAFHGGEEAMARPLYAKESLVRTSFKGGIIIESNIRNAEWLSKPDMAEKVVELHPVFSQVVKQESLDEFENVDAFKAWAFNGAEN